MGFDHGVIRLLGVALLSSGCSTIPLAPDRPEFSIFASSAAPATAMEIVPLLLGHSRAPRCASAGEESCLATVPLVHAAYLVKHPQGTFLIDSSISSGDDVARFPLMNRLALGFTRDGDLKEALAQAGVAQVDFVLITHAHWDHTGGLVDLPRPRAVLGPGELEFVRAFPKDAAPSVMPDHLAGAAVETFAWDGGAYQNFPRSHDWFGDGSVVLVPLSGHTPGSVGIFLNAVHGRRLLFIGDAAWSMDAVTRPSHKLKPLSDLTDTDRAGTSDGLWRLHHLQQHDHPLLMVPAHDGKVFDRLCDFARRQPQGRCIRGPAREPK